MMSSLNSEPTSTSTPPISWPCVNGQGSCFGQWPFRICRSVPQTPQAPTFISAACFGILRNSWFILAVLFVVRLTMTFQFQSDAAVAPLFGSEFGVSLADIGILIGLHFTPGLALALPGGAIGRKFGDKTTVLGALILMLIGTLAMALSDSWTGQIAGRLVGGAGGVLLNV